MRLDLTLAYLTPALLAPALLAQAPAAPPASARLAEDLKAVKALKAQNPAEAFARAKALLPAARPAFDRTSLQTTFAGIREWNVHLDAYQLAYDSGVACGRFEEAREVAGKGRELAQALEKEAAAGFAAYKAMWDKAGEESLKALAELTALEAKVAADKQAVVAPPPAKPDPKQSFDEANFELMRRAEAEQKKAQDVQRLAFLKSNETTFKENVEKAQKAMAPLERPTKDLQGRTAAFDAAVAQWDKYLKEESEDIAGKYKGNKALYAAGLLRGVAPKPDDTGAALVALHRAVVLDPKNPAISKRIAQLQGKASAAPAPTRKTRKG